VVAGRAAARELAAASDGGALQHELTRVANPGWARLRVGVKSGGRGTRDEGRPVVAYVVVGDTVNTPRGTKSRMVTFVAKSCRQA